MVNGKLLGAQGMSWLACGFVLLFLWVAYRYVTGRVRKASHMSRIKKNCAQVAPTDTIFVLIPALGEKDVEWLIYALFEQAYCPFRVYVGVISSEPIFERFQDVAQRSPVSERLGDHVRVAPRADGGSGLYAHEQFVLLLSGAVLVERNWDRDLVAQASPQVAITEFPRNVKYQYAHLNLRQNKANLVSRQLQRTRADPPVPPHSPCVQRQPSSTWRLPALTTALCARMPRHNTPSLFASPSCTFVEASAFNLLLQAEKARGTALPPHALTALLVEGGWGLVLPKRSLVAQVATQPWRTSEVPAQHLALAHGEAFKAYTGIHLAEGYARGKALLGLSPAFTDSEIQVKFGSYSQYHATRARLHPE